MRNGSAMSEDVAEAMCRSMIDDAMLGVDEQVKAAYPRGRFAAAFVCLFILLSLLHHII